jgi:hypothetical protein
MLPRKPALAISEGNSGHLRKFPADFKGPVSKRFDEPGGDLSSEESTNGKDNPAGASPGIKSDSSEMVGGLFLVMDLQGNDVASVASAPSGEVIGVIKQNESSGDL